MKASLQTGKTTRPSFFKPLLLKQKGERWQTDGQDTAEMTMDTGFSFG